MGKFRHDPRALAQALFARAKKLWGLALLCQLGVFGSGLLLLRFKNGGLEGPLIVAAFVLSAASAVLLWRRDVAKDGADKLLRKLDLKDSFGWELSKAEMSDLLADVPRKLAAALPIEGLGEEYFASRQPTGARRTMENLEESAWWSKHISKKMSLYCLAIALVLFCVPTLVLLLFIEAIEDADALSVVARVVVSVFALVFSLDVLRLAFYYGTFRGEAERAEALARDLLSGGSVDEVSAVKAMQDYHVARAVAPIIPSWVWKIHRSRLNELWAQYRAEH